MEDTQEDNLDNNQLEDQLEKAQAEARANLDGWKRSAADFENFKKRQEQETKEVLNFAKEVTVVKLLPSLDSLMQALKHIPEVEDEKLNTWKQGIEGLLKQLDSALGSLGVKPIEALGKKFDPHFHEAVREVLGEEDQMVVEELQQGYELNGKIIRPSQVVISKKQ